MASQRAAVAALRLEPKSYVARCSSILPSILTPNTGADTGADADQTPALSFSCWQPKGGLSRTDSTESVSACQCLMAV